MSTGTTPNYKQREEMTFAEMEEYQAKYNINIYTGRYIYIYMLKMNVFCCDHDTNSLSVQNVLLQVSLQSSK